MHKQSNNWYFSYQHLYFPPKILTQTANHNNLSFWMQIPIIICLSHNSRLEQHC